MTAKKKTTKKKVETSSNLTVGDISNPDFQAAFGKLLNLSSLPVTLAFEIAKFTKKMESELVLYQEQYQVLLSKYGNPSEVEGNFSIEKDLLEEFNKSFDELKKIKSELVPFKVNIRLLDGSNFTAIDLINLEKFLEV